MTLQSQRHLCGRSVSNWMKYSQWIRWGLRGGRTTWGQHSIFTPLQCLELWTHPHSHNLLWANRQRTFNQLLSRYLSGTLQTILGLWLQPFLEHSTNLCHHTVRFKVNHTVRRSHSRDVWVLFLKPVNTNLPWSVFLAVPTLFKLDCSSLEL